VHFVLHHSLFACQRTGRYRWNDCKEQSFPSFVGTAALLEPQGITHRTTIHTGFSTHDCGPTIIIQHQRFAETMKMKVSEKEAIRIKGPETHARKIKGRILDGHETNETVSLLLS
jgi:hypothetical protein